MYLKETIKHICECTILLTTKLGNMQVYIIYYSRHCYLYESELIYRSEKYINVGKLFH